MPLEYVKANVKPVAAGATVARRGAVEEPSVDLDVAGPAGAAFGQHGDQEARALLRPVRSFAEIRPGVIFKAILALFDRSLNVL
jgi:hypothetical protein